MIRCLYHFALALKMCNSDGTLLTDDVRGSIMHMSHIAWMKVTMLPVLRPSVQCRCHACVIGYCTVGNVYAYFLQFGWMCRNADANFFFLKLLATVWVKLCRTKLSQIVDFCRRLSHFYCITYIHYISILVTC